MKFTVSNPQVTGGFDYWQLVRRAVRKTNKIVNYTLKQGCEVSPDVTPYPTYSHSLSKMVFHRENSGLAKRALWCPKGMSRDWGSGRVKGTTRTPRGRVSVNPSSGRDQGDPRGFSFSRKYWQKKLKLREVSVPHKELFCVYWT